MAFARVLVRDPRVVILDEATARMDPVTERRVERATRRLMAGRTGIVIAHRLSTVEHCDEVVVLEDGRVQETGKLEDSERFSAILALTGEDQSEPSGESRDGGPARRVRERRGAPPKEETPESRPV